VFCAGCATYVDGGDGGVCCCCFDVFGEGGVGGFWVVAKEAFSGCGCGEGTEVK
jgi:hypothetical protein